MLINNSKKYTLGVVLALLMVLVGLAVFVSPYINNIDNIKQSCLRITDTYKRERCLEPYFEKLTLLKSPDVAVSEATDLSKKGLMVPCHIAAHYIGHANLAKNNGDVAKAIISCPDGCGEGCVHGVMEKYVTSFPSFAQALETIPKLCDSTKGDWNRRQCYHGLGHGMIQHSVMELPDGIRQCQKVKDEADQFGCMGGLYMEYMIEQLPPDRETLIKKIPHLCQSAFDLNDFKIIRGCIDRLAGALTFFTGNNLEKSQQLCDYMPNDYISLCKTSAEAEVGVNSRF